MSAGEPKASVKKTKKSLGKRFAIIALPLGIALLLGLEVAHDAMHAASVQVHVGTYLATGMVILLYATGVVLVARWLDRSEAEASSALADRDGILQGLEMHSILAYVDHRSRVVEANAMLGELLGVSTEVSRGKPLFDASDNDPATYDAFQTALAKGTPWQGELRANRASGEPLWLSVSVIPDVPRDGQLVHLLLLVDMSRQKSTDLSLRASEARFRALIESLPNLVWTCRPDGYCDYLSPQWVDYTGVPESEQWEHGWLNQLHPDDRQPTIDQWNEAFPRGKNLDVRFRIRRHDGEYRWFQTRALALKNETGDVIAWLGTNTDVQELLDIQESLRTLNEKLEDRVAQRTAELAATNESLQRVMELLSTAQSVAHVGSWEFTPSTQAMVWSDELYRIMGLEPNGEPPGLVEQTKIFTPASWQILTAALERSQTTGEGYELELEFYTPDRQTKWAIARAKTVRSPDGQVHQLVGTFQDITDLKRAQLELDQAYERIRLATSAAHMGIWDWDILRDELVWDDTMYEIYDVAPNEFSGAYMAWQRRLHPDDAAEATTAVRRALEEGEDFDTEFRIICRDGSVRYLRGSGVVHFDAEGAPIRMVGINWDITSQRQAEDALRTSEQLLRDFVRFTPAAVAMFDTDMRYLLVSDGWLKDYGLQNADIIGKTHYEVFPDVPDRWREIHRRCLQGAVEKCEEDPFPRADGHTEWLQWEIRPWHQADGSIGGVIFFTQVITARVEMQRELLEQKENLQRSNQELENFAYIASHDLQEPLRAVSSCAQIVERKYSDQIDQGGKELIGYMVEGANRMQALIHDLLDYSRAGTRELDKQSVKMSDIVEIAMRNLGSALDESGAEVQMDDLPVVEIDPGPMTQLAQNLIGNAIKYRSDAPPVIRITATDLGHDWEFRVQDNGIGIDPRFAERIFVIFKRLHTRDEYEGTGIGLAICRKIVERHGGRIWLDQQASGGSTFCFTLPKTQATALN